jgi:hypothetical protein
MKRKEHPSIKNFERLAKLMDYQFRIPGTNIRFGLDAIIGLIPGAGDITSFIISGFMLLTLAKNGASGFLLARMGLNLIVDAAIGSIPILGDLFDVAFKANQRNLKLMRQHFTEGRHTGSSGKIIIPLLVLLLLIIGFIIWAIYKLISWLLLSITSL